MIPQAVEDDFVELDDSVLPDADEVVVNWDGEEVNPKEGTWSEIKKEEAFKIGDTVITVEAVTAVSATTVVIIIICVLICMAISYRKRKAIAV